jgi:hypothetical protein
LERITCGYGGTTVLDFKTVDESICILRRKREFLNSCFINVHTPKEVKEDTEKEAFCQKVEEVYDTCPSNNILLGGLKRQNRERKKFTKDQQKDILYT